MSTQPKPSKIATTVHTNRPRAPSDPFLDDHSPTSSSRPYGKSSQAPLVPSDSIEEPLDPSAKLRGEEDELLDINTTFDDTDGEHMRTWISTDLPNPEFISLLKVFPTFITRRPLPRFPVIPISHRPPDLEEGEDDPVEGKEIRFGTGSMWVSSKPRRDGFEGGWWTRFLLWWRRLFC